MQMAIFRDILVTATCDDLLAPAKQKLGIR